MNLWQGNDKLENDMLIDLSGPDIAQPLNCFQQSLTCSIGSYEKKIPLLIEATLGQGSFLCNCKSTNNTIVIGFSDGS